MGYHDNAIRCVHYSPEVNVIITGSWDASIKLWDSRTPNCISSCSLPDKVYFSLVLIENTSLYFFYRFIH
jgi:cell cycle arrest protein BUB3